MKACVDEVPNETGDIRKPFRQVLSDCLRSVSAKVQYEGKPTLIGRADVELKRASTKWQKVATTIESQW